MYPYDAIHTLCITCLIISFQFCCSFSFFFLLNRIYCSASIGSVVCWGGGGIFCLNTRIIVFLCWHGTKLNISSHFILDLVSLLFTYDFGPNILALDWILDLDVKRLCALYCVVLVSCKTFGWCCWYSYVWHDDHSNPDCCDIRNIYILIFGFVQRSCHIRIYVKILNE